MTTLATCQGTRKFASFIRIHCLPWLLGEVPWLLGEVPWLLGEVHWL